MPNKNDLKKEQILRMSGVNPLKCMRCGKCSGTCPSYDEMEYHPHQFVYMLETGELDALIPPPPPLKRGGEGWLPAKPDFRPIPPRP